MIGTRKLLLSLIFTLAAGGFSAATDIYFAPTSAGSNNGTSCSNAYAYNDGTHGWNQSAQQSAGNNLHICAGTYTASANGTLLSTMNNGSNGNPITLIADQGAATFQAPYFNQNGAIYITNNNWTINGDNNLTIQNTLNGTQGGGCIGGACTSQKQSTGIYSSNSQNVIIENTTIIDMYLRTSTADEASGNLGISPSGIFVRNDDISSGATGIVISGNTVHDAQNCIQYGWGTESGTVIGGNTVYNCNWGIGVFTFASSTALTGMAIHDNIIHDWVAWNDPPPQSYDFHHNGIIVFVTASGSRASGLTIYNNYYYGDFGSGTGLNYLDCNAGGGASLSGTLFNNLILLSATSNSTGGNGTFTAQDESGSCSVTMKVYNNTAVGVGTMYGFWLQGNSVQAADVRNNIIYNWGTLWYLTGGAALPSPQNLNNWYLAMGGNGVWNDVTAYNTLPSWQAAHGLDENSVLQDPTLNTNGTLKAGSPSIGLATNLTSLCTGNLTALCLDKNGNPRPPSGAWDAGAIQFATIPPPTKLTAVVN